MTNGELFSSAVEGLRQTGATADEEKLVQILSAHGSEEAALLEEYQRFAAESGSSAVRYLTTLIIEDETRHHRIFAELANAIAWGSTGQAPVATTPEILEPTIDENLIDAAKKLLAFEEKDRAELEKLRRQLRDYKDTTLWSLMVDVVLLDTEKHAKMLRFVIDHLA